jgi:hypothetical protein
VLIFSTAGVELKLADANISSKAPCNLSKSSVILTSRFVVECKKVKSFLSSEVNEPIVSQYASVIITLSSVG